MYVTRPLSQYRQFPSSLSLPPPEGPNSGYLVIQDEESVDTLCFGLCKDKIRDLPFPQNKLLTVRYSSGAGENRSVTHDDVYFIPVLDKPLSSNQYYVIKAHGRHKGEAYANSREEDKVNCCFCNLVSDVKPRPFDHQDTYHQVEITPYETCCGPSGFFAKSVVEDGFPPSFLRRKGWDIHASTPHHYQLGEAQGLDASLRARLPQFDFPLFNKNSETVVVGKWYCPFMFVKEGRLKDQMKRSMFYEVTLEQQWEQIYECENKLNEHNSVVVDVHVHREVALLFGREAVKDGSNVVDGVMWFKTLNNVEGGELSVGLSLVVVERMRWEQERVGWVGGRERQVRVERVEEFQGGEGGWKRFGCYVLVERFALKRMDGSLLLTYEFRHTHQIRSKWE